MAEPNANEAGLAGGRRPIHIAYWVKDRENQKGEWHPVGVAWEHIEGRRFTLALDLRPRDGRVTVRVLEE